MFFSIGRKTRARVIKRGVFQQKRQSRALAELITKQKGRHGQQVVVHGRTSRLIKK